MKAGDLVTYNRDWTQAGVYIGSIYYGIIVETGVYAGSCDVKVLWNNGKIETSKSRMLEVISEGRRSSHCA